MKKNTGFTLAEVLITLTIIGVIAALIIPNLMRKWSDNADMAKVKTIYSIINNALKLAVIENGDITEWAWPTSVPYDKMENGQYCTSMLEKYLKIAQNCKNNRKGECRIYYQTNLQGVEGTDGTWINNYYYNVLVLQNGMTVTCFPQRIDDTREEGSIISLRVDINGSKKPNRVGYDLFSIFYNFKGLPIPISSKYCNPYQPSTGNNDGRGCVNLIIKHGNMDYKYRDVSTEW